MKKNLWISVLMTVVTTILFGMFYPLLVTGLAQLIFRTKPMAS
jgi:K+-transporting ATPase ATPase C chain